MSPAAVTHTQLNIVLLRGAAGSKGEITAPNPQEARWPQAPPHSPGTCTHTGTHMRAHTFMQPLTLPDTHTCTPVTTHKRTHVTTAAHALTAQLRRGHQGGGGTGGWDPVPLGGEGPAGGPGPWPDAEHLQVEDQVVEAFLRDAVVQTHCGDRRDCEGGAELPL